MAKLIPWEKLTPGMTVREEWKAGTGTIDATIVRAVNEDHLQIRYGGSAGSKWTQVIRRDNEHRYWDEEPTLEDREFTAWG